MTIFGEIREESFQEALTCRLTRFWGVGREEGAWTGTFLETTLVVTDSPLHNSSVFALNIETGNLISVSVRYTAAIMASTILSDLEPGMTLIDCRVRSLSHASYHGSSNETSPTASPCVSATPTNTPASGTSSPAHPAESPSLPIPPANKPASNLDSRLVHPVSESSTV